MAVFQHGAERDGGADVTALQVQGHDLSLAAMVLHLVQSLVHQCHGVGRELAAPLQLAGLALYLQLESAVVKAQQDRRITAARHGWRLGATPRGRW
ncbi:hypothetical protein LP415_09890 [Polaromonas sp. P1(28)-8]|nr:hypothetical protein LP415_09890 [Polaromonas sp. P1(28)-8]